MNRSLAIILLAIIGCGSLELLQARSAPLPGEPHRRYVRRRVARFDPDLEIVEVRNVYYVRRPKKVVTHPIGEEEMDKRMRCDFEPHRSECQQSTTPTTDDSLDRRIRCDFDPTADDCKTAAAGTPPPPRSTTRASTTTSSTTPATTTTSSTTPATTTTSSTSTTTTTTDLPLLPELTDPEEVEEVVEEQTTTEADYHLPEEDDEYIDGDEKGDDDTATDADADADADEGAADDPDEEDDLDTDPDDGNMGPFDHDSVWNSR